MGDIPGKFLGLILAFVLCVIAPLILLSTQQEMLESRMIINDISDFMDEVIDSREVTDTALSELNVRLAQYGVTVTYDIDRYARSIDSNPMSSVPLDETIRSSYQVTYVLSSDNRHYAAGDKISIHVRTVGYSSTANLTQKLTGMFIKKLDVTLTARIR